MSDCEDENFCFFGKPLDPYDEDAFPKKKPISVEEQIATDTEGRRRFHGAFTGGFSAGFFNTVGSLEGWTPSEFKSTRQDKAKGITQKPEDFMDDEDFGEYGIAHQTVKATKDFSTVKKRKRQMFPDGPIPGEPVLETLLSSGNETIGYLLLKNIGIEDKIVKQQEELTCPSEDKVYGCQMPKEYKIPKNIENKQYKIPKIYEIFLKNPKSNTFGLSYKGLDKSHLNLFQSTSLVVKEKNNKKLSIRGQAFGVGALEEEDDDIYAKEDMSKYDFELTKEKTGKKESNKNDLLYGLFKKSQNTFVFKKLYPPPNIPHSFTGKHKIRKSRFEPITEQPDPINRKEINPAIRAEQLGENTAKTYTESKSIIKETEVASAQQSDSEKNKQNEKTVTKAFDISSLLISDRFVSAGQKEEVNNILEPVQKADTTHGTQDQREAAKMKMFGRLTRTTTDWHPNSVLCKRFNVPEPFVDRPDEKNKKRTKNLIFEYQKHTEVENILTPGLLIQIKEEETPVSENASSVIDSVNVVGIETDALPENQHIEEKICQQDEGNTSELAITPKDITEKVDVAQNLDLFKAVFLSSSESEDDDEEIIKKEKSDTHKLEELKANILSDSLIPKIKPIKEGILSNVNFHKFSKPKKDLEDTKQIEQTKTNVSAISSIETEISTVTEIEEVKMASYGPMLPSEKLEIKNITKTTVMPNDSEEEWVEKSDNIKKKVKHKKKHKKEKHKKHRYEKKEEKKKRSKSDK